MKKLFYTALLFLSGALVTPIVSAQQTTYYQYDSQGRLKQAGTMDAARSMAIHYDRADNRTSLSMSKATPASTRMATRTTAPTDGSLVADKAVRDAAAVVSSYYKQ